jgi:glycerophosphoryl diester phosphodiesterase
VEKFAMLPVYPPVIVHHMAALDSAPYPPNSLEAIRACLEADAACIEIDATALAADDYLLVHDSELSHETSGQGEAGACAVEQARRLTLRHQGDVTPYRAPLLSDVVALFAQYPGATRLQIDFKNVLPMEEDEALRRLIRLIVPLGDRVIVSTGADWHLRRLHKLADWLDIGFDIGFYLDYRPNGADERMPPFRLGAYGLHDDHLLAAERLLSPRRYLSERCDVLLALVPSASTWYVSYRLIERCLEDGFDMAAWLHEHGVKLDAWTVDTDRPAMLTSVRRLLDAGVDLLTTNTPLALREVVTTPSNR